MQRKQEAGFLEQFPDRTAAGRALAAELIPLIDAEADVVVLALPRGGAPVAAPVARALRAPLDVLIVRKLGLPSQPELAMGALAWVDDAVELVRNERVLTQAAVSPEQFDAVVSGETKRLRDR